jgi:hypothetical protein
MRNYKENKNPLVGEGGRSEFFEQGNLWPGFLGAYEFQARDVGFGDLISPEEWPRQMLMSAWKWVFGVLVRMSVEAIPNHEWRPAFDL